MRIEDLKEQYPKTPDFISKMIEEEVKKQVYDQKHIKKKTSFWTVGRTAVAAAAACVVIGSGAYAAVNVYQNYHMKLEKQGSYSVVTGVTNDTEEQTQNALPDKIAGVKIETSYIPEGMERKDERHLDYIETENKGGFSFDTVLMGDGNLEEGLKDTSVEESEQTTFGEHEGVYIKYHSVKSDTTFNQRIYMLCPEENRVLILYIGSDVSKEEAYKVAEGISLTETGEMEDTADMWDWNTFIENQNGAFAEQVNAASEAETMIPMDQLQIHSMGEEIHETTYAKDTEGAAVESNDVAIKVDSIQVTDDTSLLDASYIPDEWKVRIDDNGKLKENEASYIKRGDGINTLDEVVRTESFPAKLVYATLTFTNQGELDLENLHYYIKMARMDQTEEGYRVYDYEMQSGEDADYVEWNSGLSMDGGMQYFDSQNEIGKNYISSLKAGESAQVHVAWIVNEEDLNRMYLELSGYGVNLTGENRDQAVLVEVRQ